MFTVMLYDMISHSSQPVKVTANRYVLAGLKPDSLYIFANAALATAVLKPNSLFINE